MNGDPSLSVPSSRSSALPRERVVLGITGASGAPYAEALLRQLLLCGVRTYVVFTGTGKKVVNTELSQGLLPALAHSKVLVRLHEHTPVREAAAAVGVPAEALASLRLFDNEDLYAPIASGSEGATHMVVCPSSMGTMARIAHGVSGCLLERAADVMLKERRPLIIVPRETPFSLVHLRNMTLLAEAGAHLVPAMPAFYMNPKTIDDLVGFVVERVCDALRIEALSEGKQTRWNVRSL